MLSFSIGKIKFIIIAKISIVIMYVVNTPSPLDLFDINFILLFLYILSIARHGNMRIYDINIAT